MAEELRGVHPIQQCPSMEERGQIRMAFRQGMEAGGPMIRCGKHKGYGDATGFLKLQGMRAAHLPHTWVVSGRSEK